MNRPAITPPQVPLEVVAEAVNSGANEIGRLWSWLVALGIAAGTKTPAELRAMVKRAISTDAWPEGGR